MSCTDGSCRCDDCNGQRCRELQAKILQLDREQGKWIAQVNRGGLSPSYKSFCTDEATRLATERARLLKELCSLCPESSSCAVGTSNGAVHRWDGPDEENVKALRLDARQRRLHEQRAEQARQAAVLKQTFQQEGKTLHALATSLERLGTVVGARGR